MKYTLRRIWLQKLCLEVLNSPHITSHINPLITCYSGLHRNIKTITSITRMEHLIEGCSYYSLISALCRVLLYAIQEGFRVSFQFSKLKGKKEEKQ